MREAASWVRPRPPTRPRWSGTVRRLLRHPRTAGPAPAGRPIPVSSARSAALPSPPPRVAGPAPAALSARASSAPSAVLPDLPPSGFAPSAERRMTLRPSSARSVGRGSKIFACLRPPSCAKRISNLAGIYRVSQGTYRVPKGTYRPLCPVDMHPCGCEGKSKKGTTYHVHKQHCCLPMPLLWGGSWL